MTNSTLIKHFLDRSIGWDNLFDSIATNRSNFPPYNILKTEDKGTELQLALAGYSRDDLKVTVQDKVLTISSSGVDKQDDIEYNYRGVAKRAFTINFSLGQYQEVKDVTMKDGMLYISFETVLPEDNKLKTF